MSWWKTVLLRAEEEVERVAGVDESGGGERGSTGADFTDQI